MQFSLKSMLLATTAAAVTCFSLLYARPLLGDAYYTACVAAILVAVVAAIQRQGERRAFWIGFALITAGYLWFSTPSAVARQLSVGLGGRYGGLYAEPQLVTTNLLNTCYDYLIGSDGSAGTQGWTTYPGAGSPGAYVRPLPPSLQLNLNRTAFITTGNSSIALLLGWLGGLASQRMYRSRTNH